MLKASAKVLVSARFNATKSICTIDAFFETTTLISLELVLQVEKVIVTNCARKFPSSFIFLLSGN